MKDPVSDTKKEESPAEDMPENDIPDNDTPDEQESARPFSLTFILALIALIGLLSFPWWQARWVAVVGPLGGIPAPELYQTGADQAEMAAMLSRLSERVTRLEQQLEEASQKPAPQNEPVPSNRAEITELTQQLAQLEQDVADLSKPSQPVTETGTARLETEIDKRLAPLSSRLSQIDQLLSQAQQAEPAPENSQPALQGVNDRINRIATIVAATVQLTALEQRHQRGQSLEAGLDQLARATEPYQNIQDAITALRPYEKGGITPGRLAGHFARHIARIEADLATPAQASWWRQGLSNLQATVHLRKADEGENPVIRAERALALFTQSNPEAGAVHISPDIAEAVSILSPYAPQSQVLSDWLTQANQWLLSKAALDQLRQQIAAAVEINSANTAGADR